MLRVLQAGLFGLACAQYTVTNTKQSANEIEYTSLAKDGKSKTELRMRIRTTTDDNTLEMEIESRSEANKTKVNARTRFNIREVYLYDDDNKDLLLSAGENSTEYDLSRQWGSINCTSTVPYNCDVCNIGGLPANALCFQFMVTDTTTTFGTHTVTPTTVKINMLWNPSNVADSATRRVALIGRFRSVTTFKAREAVGTNEEGQGSADGSMVKWETRVSSPGGKTSDVKSGVYIPSSSGVSDGTEQDKSDGSSMSYRQLQFSFVAADPFTWDPDIVMPVASAFTAGVPLVLITCLSALLF